MEKEIKLAAKLYQCRDAAKSLFKNEYLDKLKPYMHILNQVCKCNDLEPLQALLKVAETRTFQDSDMAQLMFFAATVEMIEPGEPTGK